jgi:hypothetical protein
LRIAEAWSDGTGYERRAAAAAVAEPRLLSDPAAARRAVAVYDHITGSFVADPGDRREDALRALRKTLGYGWSVVIVADPEHGKAAFERWTEADDRDVRWICRENLRKARLVRMDPDWVAACVDRA